MADYEMTLSIGNKIIIFPVVPEKLAVKSPGKNETAVVLELGEINIIRQKGLREIAWDSFFPANMGPYVTGRAVGNPITYIKDLQAARDQKKHGRFRLTGSDLNVNMLVAVESIDYDERGGEPGDIYYNIKLKEWKDYSAVTISTGHGKKAVRSGKPAKAEELTHTVVAGDCLWAIAQQYYGDGSRYPELYAKHKSLIDAKNAGTGNPSFTIYPGQKLVL
nr:MAG TPA: tail assembly protein [Caudoviricetes sp.]